jgi:hypothetical protein
MFRISCVVMTAALSCLSGDVHSVEALKLHPANPHYFLFREKPTVLITSGEHYGCVANLDFDYVKYLETLAAHGFNLTRIFTGATYCEPVGAFNIAQNAMAPLKGRFNTPWARSDQPGAWDDGNKWDLTRWNEDYFKRFRDFVDQASQRGIVVEVNLFCPFYEEGEAKQSKMWPLSPFHPSNNINGLGNISSHDVYTLDKNGGLLAPQERFVRRIVEELKDFDNVFYEVCNEPYFAGVTMDWQHYIADMITEAQRSHPHPKLISQNIANHSARVTKPHPAVSIFTFHYAYPPVAVADNYALNKAIGENETGFRGTSDEVYRNEAWDFLLAGGSMFNNLDFSFVAGHEDGTFAYPDSSPGGGGVNYHKQLAVLVKFMSNLEFVAMRPANDLVRALPAGTSMQALANPGKQYAAYLHHSAKPSWKSAKKLNTGSFQDTFELDAPAATYQIDWTDPATGKELANEIRNHTGGALKLQSPMYAQDLAVRISAK